MVCLENNLKRTRNTQAEQETFQAGRLAGSQLWRGKGFGMWKREKRVFKGEEKDAGKAASWFWGFAGGEGGVI